MKIYNKFGEDLTRNTTVIVSSHKNKSVIKGFWRSGSANILRSRVCYHHPKSLLLLWESGNSGYLKEDNMTKLNLYSYKT